jgi:prepilin-type N-terminal cleavage/methylation domain-containing protein/prepilin-type processing-associated H-X9-DG protein
LGPKEKSDQALENRDNRAVYYGLRARETGLKLYNPGQPGRTIALRTRLFKPSGGFTLIEILVVISIVSVMAAMLAPAITLAREKARRVQCMNNMHQIGLAEHQYANDYGGWFYVKMADWTGSTVVWQPMYGNFPHYFEGLQKYVKVTSVFYCPSVLTKNPRNSGFGSNSNIIQPWGSMFASNVSYGYVAALDVSVGPDYILMFEKPSFIGSVKGWTTTDPLFMGGNHFFLELDTTAVYKSDRVTSWSGGNFGGELSGTAHGNLGSNVLYVDGRVAWISGSLIGPFYGRTETPPGFSPTTGGSPTCFYTW